MKKLYVGNLSYETTESELQSVFEEVGQVQSAIIIRDKWDNSSKGFGFIEMADDSAADTAMDTLNGRDLNGRELRVNEARERRDDNRRSGGGGGGGGGGRGGQRRDDRRGGGGGGGGGRRW